jgi:hypothetical protein
MEYLDLEFKAKKYPIYWSYDKGIVKVILDGLPDGDRFGKFEGPRPNPGNW